LQKERNAKQKLQRRKNNSAGVLKTSSCFLLNREIPFSCVSAHAAACLGETSIAGYLLKQEALLNQMYSFMICIRGASSATCYKKSARPAYSNNFVIFNLSELMCGQLFLKIVLSPFLKTPKTEFWLTGYFYASFQQLKGII